MRLGYVGTINGAVNDEVLKAMSNVIPREKKYDLHNISYEKRKYDEEFYYIVPDGNGNDIYKKLPSVVDDDVFIWNKRTLKNNKKNLWTNIKRGIISFNITYYIENDSVAINVFRSYTNCFHPNYKIRIDRVNNNMDIVNVINDFIDDYKHSVSLVERI